MAKAKEMDKLTQDSIAAQKAGMSYGQYMATKEPVIPPRKNQGGVRYGVCLYCGKSFVMDKRDRVYCGYQCSNYHYRKRKRDLLKGVQASEQAENVRDE